MLCRVKLPQIPVALPLDYASELAMELHMMRAECSAVAEDLMEQRPLDEASLQECAVLDDALVQTNLLLRRAVGAIKASRAKRSQERS